MKYAILSDIHSNLEALSVTLLVCQNLGVDQYLCLGDIVGYNANPQECMNIVRELPLLGCVKGNHDDYASNGDEEFLGFNQHAREAVEWTRRQLNPESLDFLAKLPYKMNVKGTGITLVHATLDSPETWGYVFDAHHAADNFSYQFTPLCFCGHSHSPIAFCKKPAYKAASGRDIVEIPDWCWAENEDGFPADPTSGDALVLNLQPGWKYLINVGSVGQPRNRDPRASFAIYDDEKLEVARYRIPYDIATAQAKIREAGLPDRLAKRLEFGK